MNRFALPAALAAAWLSAAHVMAAPGQGQPEPEAASPALPQATPQPPAQMPQRPSPPLPIETPQSQTLQGSDKRPDDDLLYALGLLLSRGLQNFQLSEAEFARVSSGIADGYRRPADVAQAAAYSARLSALLHTRVEAARQREEAAGLRYIAGVAASRGARKTASGLVYVPIAPGKGPAPTLRDAVKLNYQAKLADGTVFDSSAARGEPAVFVVDSVMRCLTEALQLVKVGGRSRIVCPPDLAYGDRGSEPKVPPGATVEYDIEMLAIVARPPPKPEDLKD